MSANQQLPTMRQKAIQGGLFLTIRQGLSVGLGVLGLLYMTRIVGPAAYGLYAAAFGLVRYFTLLSEGGVKMYLLRAPRDVPMALFQQAFWWLLFVSLGAAIVLPLLLLVVGRVWVRTEGFTPVAVALSLSLPLTLLASVPMAIVERTLEYRRVALVEILSQVGYYVIGIALAWGGWGVWAFVGAFWTGQAITFAGYFLAARFHPHWQWDNEIASQMTRESIKLGMAAWIYELRLLGPSIILLPLTNETVAGYFGLAQRLLSTLGFVRDAIARLSVPVYARVQANKAKLLEVAHLASLAQMLGLASLYLPLAFLGSSVLPLLFGNKWDTSSVLMAFTVMATNQLFFVIFGALNQTLLVVGQAHVFAKAGGAYVLVNFALSTLLILLLPEPLQLLGYTLGVSIAYFLTYYWMMHVHTARYIGKPRYGMNLIWATGLGAVMFAPFTHYWSLLGLLVFLHPASVRALREIMGLLREARGAKSKAARH